MHAYNQARRTSSWEAVEAIRTQTYMHAYIHTYNQARRTSSWEAVEASLSNFQQAFTTTRTQPPTGSHSGARTMLIHTHAGSSKFKGAKKLGNSAGNDAAFYTGSRVGVPLRSSSGMSVQHEHVADHSAGRRGMLPSLTG
jgi:hypothetical protein